MPILTAWSELKRAVPAMVGRMCFQIMPLFTGVESVAVGTCKFFMAVFLGDVGLCLLFIDWDYILSGDFLSFFMDSVALSLCVKGVISM